MVTVNDDNNEYVLSTFFINKIKNNNGNSVRICHSANNNIRHN